MKALRVPAGIRGRVVCSACAARAAGTRGHRRGKMLGPALPARKSRTRDRIRSARATFTFLEAMPTTSAAVCSLCVRAARLGFYSRSGLSGWEERVRRNGTCSKRGAGLLAASPAAQRYWLVRGLLGCTAPCKSFLSRTHKIRRPISVAGACRLNSCRCKCGRWKRVSTTRISCA